MQLVEMQNSRKMNKAADVEYHSGEGEKWRRNQQIPKEKTEKFMHEPNL